MRDFMLASLAEEQRTLLRLMERAVKAQIPEAATLAHALEGVVSSLRDLRAERIGWQDAARSYQVACAIEQECELALLFPVVDLSVQRDAGAIGRAEALTRAQGGAA